MQFEFWDGGHTDLPLCGGSTGLSVTDSSQGWTVITAADALSCTMSREIAKAMAVSTASTIATAHREKLAIGCTNLHIIDSVTGFLQEGVSGDATP